MTNKIQLSPRVQGSIALAAIGLTFIVSSGNHQANAQSSGQTLQQAFAEIAVLKTRMNIAETELAALRVKTQYVSVNPITKTMLISGANLQVVNGAGSTATVNGLGNIKIGYDENSGFNVRSGSHNLVVGSYHNYSSFAGQVIGIYNTISGQYASVSGGASNTASGINASVSGGYGNIASGASASVSGGASGSAIGSWASVVGGTRNRAIGNASTNGGGYQRTAYDPSNWVAGGLFQPN